VPASAASRRPNCIALPALTNLPPLDGARVRRRLRCQVIDWSRRYARRDPGRSSLRARPHLRAARGRLNTGLCRRRTGPTLLCTWRRLSDRLIKPAWFHRTSRATPPGTARATCRGALGCIPIR